MKQGRLKTNLFRLFIAWVFLSAFYYAPNLIEGQLLVDRSENFGHKVAKYLVAMAITAIYAACYRDVKVLVQGGLLGLFACMLGVALLGGYNVIFGLELMLVLMAFFGLAHYSARLSNAQVSSLARAISYSALMISIVSYFEYTVFESVLGDHWKYTGGFRSVSTLLNPNNFGVYLGAVLVLLSFSQDLSSMKRLIFGAVIVGAFYLSGSRTAWVSFTVVALLGAVYRGNGLVNRKSLRNLAIAASVVVPVIVLVLISGVVELPDRATDFYTAYIRLEKYFEFILGVDSSYVLPDFNEARIEMVSESGYFHFINAVGLIFFAFMVLVFSPFFRIDWFTGLLKKGSTRGFALVLIYYCIATLFENVVMSFPNNQLIFISIGVTVAAWRARKHEPEMHEFLLKV